MESLFIYGVNGSGTIVPSIEQQIVVKSIDFNLPVNASGTPSVTLSGDFSGSFPFYNDVTATLKFAYNETVNITSSLSAGYGVVINYLTVGDQIAYRESAIGRDNLGFPLPTRFRLSNPC